MNGMCEKHTGDMDVRFDCGVLVFRVDGGDWIVVDPSVGAVEKELERGAEHCGAVIRGGELWWCRAVLAEGEAMMCGSRCEWPACGSCSFCHGLVWSQRGSLESMEQKGYSAKRKSGRRGHGATVRV